MRQLKLCAYTNLGLSFLEGGCGRARKSRNRSRSANANEQQSHLIQTPPHVREMPSNRSILTDRPSGPITPPLQMGSTPISRSFQTRWTPRSGFPKVREIRPNRDFLMDRTFYPISRSPTVPIVLLIGLVRYLVAPSSGSSGSHEGNDAQ
eukprot:scaffold2631_cov373-Pavlova_lutheri.AAC.3